MREYSLIGQRIPHIEAPLKAQGQAEFTDDIVLPGMLYGRILRSPHPHARILHIDTSRAERVPGVRAVITGQNTPMVIYGTIPGVISDEYPLAVEKVNFVGDEVAAVAAVDEDTAQEALELIDVEYEPLPAVFDPEEAMKPGAPRIHPGADSNVGGNPVIRIQGDVDKGFRESDYVREDRFRADHVTHCQLEPKCCVADFEVTGELTVWSSTQVPFLVRLLLAHTLELPESKVRVIKPFVGGGFGGKADMNKLEVCSALLSRVTGKPVKMRYARDEHFLASRHRQPNVIDLKTGARSDGTLMAMQCRYIADGGAYASWGFHMVVSAGGFIDCVFRLPNVKYEGYMVYTNKPPTGAMRGFGQPNFRFAIDSQMNLIAGDLGIDLADFYLKNASQEGDVTLAGFKLNSWGLSDCIKSVVEESGWREKKGELPFGRGVGLGLGDHTCGYKAGPFDDSSAIVKINSDGYVRLIAGASDIGQGVNTIMAQCVAEELGIPLERVTVNIVDTAISPPDMGTYASRATIQTGRAAIAAAVDARRQLLDAVAEKLEISPEDLESSGGRIFVKGSPDRGMTFKDGVALFREVRQGATITGVGHFEPETEPLHLDTGMGHHTAAYGCGAQVVEVEVDTETGKVKVLNVFAANDGGKVLNPLSLEGQTEGGIVMGMGQALGEKVHMDRQGRILNTSFLNYPMPTALEVPNIKMTWVETTEPDGPCGAKGIAEVVLMPIIPAIANAIDDAVGVRIKELPITPEKVLQALDKQKRETTSNVESQ